MEQTEGLQISRNKILILLLFTDDQVTMKNSDDELQISAYEFNTLIFV